VSAEDRHHGWDPDRYPDRDHGRDLLALLRAALQDGHDDAGVILGATRCVPCLVFSALSVARFGEWDIARRDAGDRYFASVQREWAVR
jgi:hypothetical protein